MDNKSQSAIGIPGAIIIASTILAITIIWINKPAPAATDSQAAALGNLPQVAMRPVDSTDHILGNPDAPIKIVEYSDPSCPFCKTFHPTMRQIMNEYGSKGQVAWVYRHFPLDKASASGQVLHPNAGIESQAMECAADQGGNDKFWAFTNRLYDVTPSVTPTTPKGLDPKQLPVIAKATDLDVSTFEECLSSGKFKDKVERDYLDGVNAGVSGTPYSIIVTPSGNNIPLPGAQPISTLKLSIDTLLSDQK